MPGKIKYKVILMNKYDDLRSEFRDGYWYIMRNNNVLTRDSRPYIAWRNAYQILELNYCGLRERG